MSQFPDANESTNSEKPRISFTPKLSKLTSLKFRFWIVTISNLALLVVYIPFLAQARVSGTYSWFSRPWGNYQQSLLVFTFAAIALVFALPILFFGSKVQRIRGSALIILPGYVLGRYLWRNFHL